MASLKKDDSISKRQLYYWQQGADNPPEADPTAQPQWHNLDDPTSPAGKAGAVVWRLLDVVAQCDYTGQPRKDEDMVELQLAFVAYMDLAYVGAQHNQLEKWIAGAKRQYELLVELSADGKLDED